MPPFTGVAEFLSQVDNPLTLLEGLFVHSPIGVQLFSPSGRSLYVNKAFVDIFGVAPPPEYSVLRDVVAARLGVDSIIRDAFAGKVTKLPVTWYDPGELEHVKVTGGKRCAIETFLIPICDETGAVKYVVFIHRDATAEQLLEQQRQEIMKKLRDANSLIESLMNGTEAVIYAKDVDGRFLFVNRQYGLVVNRAPEDIIGKLQRDIHPPEVAAKMRETDIQALDGRHHLEVEESVYHPDGSWHEYLSLKFPLADSDGRVYGVCGISTDITMVRRLEKELGQARRMEALGLLAGGVAHDFNNLLGMILLHAESISRSIPGQSPDVEQDFLSIRMAIERASALVRQLLAFGRRLPMKPRSLSLNGVINDMSFMLTKLAGEGARFELALCTGPTVVQADPTRVEQVLLNLCLNAREAVAGSGTIRIRTGSEAITAVSEGLRLPKVPGDYSYFEVEDNGRGMDTSVLERAFDPFFTTKDQSEGRGLGLPSVFGILQESKGNLRITTAPGRGCTVRVFFPAAAEAAEALAMAPVARAETAAHALIALVVEDEPLLREITARNLRHNGFKVLEAGGASEVPAILRENPGVSVVLSDVIMPGKSGPAMVKELEAQGLLKGVGVVFVSGYSSDELAQYGFSGSTMHLLEKPFSTESLLQKIQEAVAQAQGKDA
ncbi:MAG: PAS domain-containing protein [Bdellovibrionota bacterium]